MSKEEKVARLLRCNNVLEVGEDFIVIGKPKSKRQRLSILKRLAFFNRAGHRQSNVYKTIHITFK
jgi:hypothetical protein